MTFKEATEGIPADILADALRVAKQTVWQYRLDPSSDGYRSPPAGWQTIVAGILQSKGDEHLDRARLLADLD